MLYESMLLLENQLNDHFEKLHEAAPGNIIKNPVKLENIVSLNEEELKSTESVFLSLVNISEEFTLKNVPAYRKEGAVTVYQNPPVFLNLYILICSCMPKTYKKALMHLSHVIRFFQAKNVFTRKNSFSIANAFSELENYKLILDLYSPTFEQANYLWSTLGGKQHPYVLYKLRMLEMEKESISEQRGVISQIQINEGPSL